MNIINMNTNTHTNTNTIINRGNVSDQSDLTNAEDIDMIGNDNENAATTTVYSTISTNTRLNIGGMTHTNTGTDIDNEIDFDTLTYFSGQGHIFNNARRKKIKNKRRARAQGIGRLSQSTNRQRAGTYTEGTASTMSKKKVSMSELEIEWDLDVEDQFSINNPSISSELSDENETINPTEK